MGVKSTRELTRQEALELLCERKAEIRIKIAKKRIMQDIMWEIEDLSNEEVADALDEEYYNYSVRDNGYKE